jgi:hypothetical protein
VRHETPNLWEAVQKLLREDEALKTQFRKLEIRANLYLAKEKV